ncbi:MAG: hypothetical protein HKO93_04400, partial [Flavobacteriales bacterium]|nr:hypothetical protein [Flavobacteriales bacterium]
MYRILIALFPVLFIFACSSEKRDFPHSEPILPLKTGIWRLTLEIGNEMLPVNFQVRNESGLKVDIINAEERITIYEFIQTGDSLRLRMPLFDSEFLGVVSSDRSFYS